jgi:hypothetical protein
MGRSALSHSALKSIWAGPLPGSAPVGFVPKGITMKQTRIGIEVGSSMLSALIVSRASGQGKRCQRKPGLYF